MTTALKLGPADHGRPLALEEYESAAYEAGHRYELIFGRLEVSPLPDLAQDYAEGWLLDRLKAYAREHPEVINHVTNKARVFVEGHDAVSCPEPDIACYRDFPHEEFENTRWQDLQPVLIVEVLSPERPEKDLERNPEVYLLISGLREYWVLDTRPGAARPELIVHKRHGRRWRMTTVEFDGIYSTRLLPGFTLIVNPRR